MAITASAPKGTTTLTWVAWFSVLNCEVSLCQGSLCTRASEKHRLLHVLTSASGRQRIEWTYEVGSVMCIMTLTTR